MDVARNVLQANKDVEGVLSADEATPYDPDAVVQRVHAPIGTWADFKDYFSRWSNGKILLVTAFSWFANDVSIPQVYRYSETSEGAKTCR